VLLVSPLLLAVRVVSKFNHLDQLDFQTFAYRTSLL